MAMLHWLRHLGEFLLRGAYKILGVYTLLLFAVPSRVLLPLGITIWIAMAVACIWAFFTAQERRPSFIATFTFFVVFSFEVLFSAGQRLP
jgi:hypothetical protein